MIALPARRDWLFSARTFAAAMLALYIALALGLPRPSWAMGTVYIVSHPLIGATRSKAVYRVFGTLLGAAAAVFVVPPLANEPVLLSLVVALWSGSLLYLSMLDHTPRHYLLRLPAYTMPLIALSAVYAPENVFDIAVARSEEIALGIVCASVVAALVLPTRVSAALSPRVDGWLRDAAAWATDTLGNAPQPPSAGRNRLAADLLAFDQLLTHLSYDATSRNAERTAGELRARMSMLPPLLSSLSELLAALRKTPGGASADLLQLMGDVSDWLGYPADNPWFLSQARALRRRLDQPPPDSGWPSLLEGTARMRLKSLVNLWQDCLTLRALISRGLPLWDWKPAYRRWEVGVEARHYDYGLLAFAAGTAALGIFLGCLVWIALGWQDGANAVILGTIACCLFGSMDEPAPMLRTMFVVNTVCTMLAGLLLFAVLPAVHEFEMLALCLAPPFLLGGALLTQPRFGPVAMLLVVFTANLIGLQQSYNADFQSFLNSNLAGAAGILFALVWTLTTRPFGAELTLRRLIRSNWRDLAHNAAGRHGGDYARLTALMLDRLSLLAPRLAADGADPSAGFRELRVGFSALDLQRDEHRLAGAAHQAVDAALQGVSEHFRACAQADRYLDAPDALLGRLDAAIALTLADPAPAAREARGALVEMRVSLFPDAEGCQPASPVPGVRP
ncbi:transporter [Chromobacterium violaceum]|uniref:FUSC family protein n=1 Tax=Chromobacterium violaceum TaxID=536 RepID=UPI0006532ADA|nr:FUSC family protein [Chromobacterium violaceum]KMN48011.1 transporter [Chromobacterium violaceum]KMN86414.1 transporter [Chromobacterium violaceum]KMN91011.1 transporter [Chromobacterium violaceum]KMO05608.1 transporter [Chromobacterium violaceum]